VDNTFVFDLIFGENVILFHFDDSVVLQVNDHMLFIALLVISVIMFGVVVWMRWI